jgi:hypothetical protein
LQLFGEFNDFIEKFGVPDTNAVVDKKKGHELEIVGHALLQKS